MDPEAVRSQLRLCELFKDISPETLAEVAAKVAVHDVGKGTLLFQEGDPGEGLFVVLKGTLRIYHALADGREFTMHLAGPGEPVAMVCLLEDVSYPASAEGYTHATVALLPRPHAFQLLENEPDLAFALLRMFSRLLQRAHHRTQDLALLRAHERVAAALLAWPPLDTGDGYKTIRLGSRVELAKMVGTARETVARALSDFQRDGAVHVSGDHMVIDVGRLSRWAGVQGGDEL